MKIAVRSLITFGLILFFLPGSATAETPKEICGITLGKNIEDYADSILLDTAMPIRYQPYLKEAEIKKQNGVRGGLVMYGTCANPGRIIRIKIKFSDKSKTFYEKYLDHLKDKFGEPLEWKGDSFGMHFAWKWVFNDKDTGRITMILEHNTIDPEEGFGTSIKLTLPALTEEEIKCYDKTHPGHNKRKMKHSGKYDWDKLLPK